MRKHSKRASPSSYLVALVAGGVLLVACSRVPMPLEAAQTGAGVISVCEALRNLEALNGKRVTVKGIFWFGLRDRCDLDLREGDRQWPNALYIEHSDATKSRSGVRTDGRQWEAVDRAVLAEATAGRHEEIWVTITGELQGQLKPFPIGFGHLGAFPGRIVVEKIVISEIIKRPTYDYGQLAAGKPHL